jgi:hypothetical protein
MSIYPQQPQDERFRRLRRLLDEEYKKNILYALKEVQVEREERHDPESHSNNNTEHDPYEMFLLFFAIFGGVVFFLFIIAASFR